MSPDASTPAASNSKAHWLVLAGVLAALGVAAGAFGAHGLRSRVSPEQLEWWQTAARYHQIHTLALLLVAWIPGPWPRLRSLVAGAFVFGVLIFAGTLYAMALGGPRILGAITPLGGLSLILAYLGIAKLGWDARSHSKKSGSA